MCKRTSRGESNCWVTMWAVQNKSLKGRSDSRTNVGKVAAIARQMSEELLCQQDKRLERRFASKGIV